MLNFIYENSISLFFYSFVLFSIVLALLVLFVNNPIYSILCLIFTFCMASGILLLFDADFIALILVIIYVGAIAVLFLFIVMMLNIRNLEQVSQLNFLYYLSSILGIFIFMYFINTNMNFDFEKYGLFLNK